MVKKTKMPKRLLSAAIACVLSISGACVYGEDTENAEMSPYIYYKNNKSYIYDDDFESWKSDITIDDAVVQAGLGVSGQAPSKNMWNQNGGQVIIKNEDGDKSIHAETTTGNRGFVCNGIYDFSVPMDLGFRLRLTSDSGAVGKITMNSGGSVHTLLTLSENGIVLFGGGQKPQPQWVIKEDVYGKWYTFDISIDFTTNIGKFKISDDDGKALFESSYSDFRTVFPGGSWFNPSVAPMIMSVIGNGALDLSYFKAKSVFDDSIKDINGPIIEKYDEADDRYNEIQQPEKGKIRTSYNITNIKLDDNADNISAGILNALYDDGKFVCTSYQNGIFEPKYKGDEIGEHEFISHTYTTHNDYAMSGAVSGKIGTVMTVEAEKPEIKSYLLSSADGFRFYGKDTQKKASITNAAESVEDQSLTIEGKLDDYTSSDKALLYVIEKDKSLADLETDNSSASEIVHLKELEVNADGSFSYTFMPNFDKGDYTIGIGGSHVTSAENMKSFYYYSPQDLANANTAAKNIKTADDVKAYIEENGRTFSLKEETYQKLEEADGLDEMYALSAAGAPYADAAELNRSIEKNTVCVLIRKLKNAEKAWLIDKYAVKYFGLDKLEVWEMYSSEKNETKNKILNIFDEMSDVTADKFNDAFTETVIVGELRNNTVAWGDVDKLVSAYKDIIGADSSVMSKYTENTKRGICNRVVNKKSEVSNIADFRRILTEAIKAETSSNSGSGENSGSGSGSGGTRSRLTVVPSASETGYTPEYTPEETKEFADIDSVSWAKEAITEFFKKGFINGKDEKTFAPNDPIKREEFLKILMNAFDIPKAENNKEFKDVDADEWFSGYVCGALKEGICSGIGESMFGSGMDITRQDIAVMIYRTAVKKGYRLTGGTEADYEDSADIAEYAREAADVLSAEGIITGSNNKFMPENPATRAEATVMLYRLYRLKSR